MMKLETKKKIVIIGGGLSGLSAGIYALKAGFEAEIYEKNPVPGGLCVSWLRKGFTVDGCIHWLTGTKQRNDLFNIWKDLGVIDDSRSNIIDHADAGIFEVDGKQLTIYCDLDKLEQELLRVSPEDKKEIKRFMKYLKVTYKLPVPLEEPINTMNFFKLTKVGCSLLPYLRLYNKLKKIKCSDYAKRFKSPLIQYMINAFQPGPGAVYPFIYSMATVVSQNGGLPKGGSQAFINSILKTYLDLGGKIFYNKPVKKIEIEGKKATSIVFEDDNKVSGDYIVSAIDAKYLLDVLLEKKIKDKKLDKRFADPNRYKTPTCFTCYFAVDEELVKKTFKSHQVFFNTTPFKVGNREIYGIKVRNFSYDDSFTHNGKTIIEILIEQYNQDYDYWFNLYSDKEAYKKEKEKVVKYIKDAILAHFSELKDSDLDLLDCYSPATINRYTNSYCGAFMSFMMNKNSPVLFHKGRFKGVDNLYFASQWEQTPGGLPLAASSGRFAIQRILKKEGRNHHFKPSK